MGLPSTPRLSPPIQLTVVASVVAIGIYRIILWRARSRAKTTVDRMGEIIAPGGPLVCGFHLWMPDQKNWRTKISS